MYLVGGDGVTVEVTDALHLIGLAFKLYLVAFHHLNSRQRDEWQGSLGRVISPVSTRWVTSCMAAPTSHSLASIPAVLIPVSVASCTPFFSGSNLGLKDSVQAQSIILPCPQRLMYSVTT